MSSVAGDRDGTGSKQHCVMYFSVLCIYFTVHVVATEGQVANNTVLCTSLCCVVHGCCDRGSGSKQHCVMYFSVLCSSRLLRQRVR